MKVVGERLKALRESVGVSQARLAKTFGTIQSNIFRYESGNAGVPGELLVKYADFFDVSLDYIFGRTDDPHGRHFEAKPNIEKSYPEMDKFIEMCFEPGSVMNERLKETLKKMMTEETR